MLQNIIVLLVWFSCIYKQNIVSMFLYVILVIYSQRRTPITLLLVRTSIAVLIVLQYWIDVFDLSSYNSPKPFPEQVVNTTQGHAVYPNQDQFFYNIPVLLSFNATRDDQGQIISSEVNLNVTSYFCMDIERRKMNGLWLDYLVTILVYLYFNTTNLWLLFKPIKVTRSENTRAMLARYAQITREPGDPPPPPRTMKQVIRDLKQQVDITQSTHAWQSVIFTIFPLLMIAFTLAVSIFNKSLLSFGYIIFVMFLIEDSKYFFKEWASKERLLFILEYMLLPYLLFDILLQLIYQMPFKEFSDNKQSWSNVIGFGRVWAINPSTLSLGQEVQPSEHLNVSLAILMLKGVTFFFISLYIQLIRSRSYLKFMHEKLAKQSDQTLKIGQGITYRFNNFKNKKVIKYAQEVDRIEKMLWHVKLLLKKRDLLYRVQKESEAARLRRIKSLNTDRRTSLKSTKSKGSKSGRSESATRPTASRFSSKSFKRDLNLLQV